MRSVYGVGENIVDVGDDDAAAVAVAEAPVSVDVGLKLVPLLLLLTYLNVVVFGIAVDAMWMNRKKKRISKIFIISSWNVCPEQTEYSTNEHTDCSVYSKQFE